MARLADGVRSELQTSEFYERERSNLFTVQKSVLVENLTVLGSKQRSRLVRSNFLTSCELPRCAFGRMVLGSIVLCVLRADRFRADFY